MTPPEFSTALFKARHGDRFCYFRGHLQQARQAMYMDSHKRSRLNELAKDVMAAVAAGHGRVFQRRHGPDDYEYLFERTVAA